MKASLPSQPVAPNASSAALAWRILGGLAIALAALLAYSNSFRVPFVFDDLASIPNNPTIRSLSEAWWPPKGQGALTVAGRPGLNFSFGLNYALNGLDVGGYHVFNFAIHLIAALALYGLVSRTLLLPRLAARFGRDARPLALLVALLWALHPLQTEAVTYIVQRAESLMGMFFLLAFYGFVRSVDSVPALRWRIFCWAMCLCGAASKEITIVVPVLIFLYDRTFVSGSFREAWRRHRGMHLALLATWGPLLVFVASTGGNRSGVFHLDDTSMWLGHGLTQFEAIVHYFRLTFWPHPLTFEYGEMVTAPTLAAVLPWAVPVIALAGATLVALWRRPAAGFLGAWVFAILFPTSALPATLQIIVEHRMYLPLAAILTFVVTGVYLLAGRRAFPLLLVLAVGAGWLTYSRNMVYRTELSLWGDTTMKRPLNDHALVNYGLALAKAGRHAEAAEQFAAAVRIQPNSLQARNNLGNSLALAGRYDEAIVQYEFVLRARPNEPGVIQNLEQVRMLREAALRRR
jgi:hypothetical protein